MDGKPHVVFGEASESDNEEEQKVPVVPVYGMKSPTTPQGTIIAGEAPESDEEIDDAASVSSVSSAASVSSVASLTTGITKPKSTSKDRKKEGAKYNSLLHKKLRERNMSLHKNIGDFVHQVVSSSCKELNVSNQQLLRSQVQLQEATSSLQLLQNTMLQLEEKLNRCLSASFLPHINTKSL